jgi:hypothetical protein
MKRNKNALFLFFCFFTKFKKGISFQPYGTVVEESIDIEYRVSDYKILKSIGVSISNTGIEVSEYRISNTEKSIGCPALLICAYEETDTIKREISLTSLSTCEQILRKNFLNFISDAPMWSRPAFTVPAPTG